jgi:RecA-family ATPase
VGRVPLGMITMFAGDPKLGKSFVTLAMAAAVSRGLPLPMSNVPNEPGSTILMSAEDDPTRTIVPLIASLFHSPPPPDARLKKTAELVRLS